MKNLFIVLASFVVAAPAVAQLAAGNPDYDPFANATNSGGTSYTPGDPLAGQASAVYAAYKPLTPQWYERTGTGSSGLEPTISSNDLSYPEFYSASGDGSVQLTNAGDGNGALMNFSTGGGGITSGSAYFSYLLQVTDLTGLDTNGVALSSFTQLQNGGTVPGAQGAVVLIRSDGAGGFNVGLQRGGKATSYGTLVWGATSYNPGDSVLIVGDWVFIGSDGNSGSTDDVANLWIDPDPSTFGADSEPAPDLTSIAAGSSERDIERAASIMLLDNAGGPTALIDDLRVGLNWEDVTPNGNFVKILQDPRDQTLSVGDTATFSVVADGSPPLTYQWIKDGSTLLSDGGTILGAYSNVLTISNISSSDLGSYAVYVTNSYGKFVLSGSANLSLADPAISGQPQDSTNDYGTTATFEVEASGTSPFTYQWHKDGGDLNDNGSISGSHSNILNVANLSYLDAGGYSVTVTNASGSTADSAVAHLTVNDPFISTQPLSASNGAGNTVTFHVEASGTPTFSYYWFKDGKYLFDGDNVSGAYTDTLTVSNISAADEASYFAVAIGGSGNSVTSSVVSLTVLSPVTITAQPNPRTVAPGSRVAFVAGAGGSGPFGYQWLLEGTNVPGATAQAYELINAQSSDQGNYSVIITNAFSSLTSAPAPLVISQDLHLDETNLIIIRVGDGAETLSLNGNSIALDQFTPDGNYVNTITIPDDGPSGMVDIGWDNVGGVNSGSTTGSCLTRSLDGRFMVIAGYNTNLSYGASLVNSLSIEVPRGIGLIDSFAQYTMPVANTDSVFDKTYWRAALSDGTNNYWGSGGISGTYYFGFDSPSALVQSTFVNARSMGLFNGNIYCAEASNPNGILKIDGLPTSTNTPTQLFGGSGGTFDMAVSPDGNLIYVADQRGINTSDPNSGGGVERWEFDGANWNLAYTLIDGFGTKGPRYVAADFSGANPVLYVTSNDNTFDNNRLVRVVDTGAASTGTTLAYAGVNQTFRGIHFGPVPNTTIPRPVLSFQPEGGSLILNWNGTYMLQSAPDVTGPYSDVSGGASPYTNSITATNQLFFRLRN